jgi:hypothetical protein
MKKFLVVGFLVILGLAVSNQPSQADFFLCPNACTGSENADIIIGSAASNTLDGAEGADVIFGQGESDLLVGRNDNDILFGGPGDDTVQGDGGDDILLAGPDDDATSFQTATGLLGNDQFHVFVGEILGCLGVFGDVGFDVLNLIGFGPYSATVPFGQPGFGTGFLITTDPITGGTISVRVSENDDSGVDTINGLMSPNVTIVGTQPLECTN